MTHLEDAEINDTRPATPGFAAVERQICTTHSSVFASGIQGRFLLVCYMWGAHST